MICLLTFSLVVLQESPEKIVLDLGGDVKMEFVRIKAGKFTMGDKDIRGATPHEVTFTKDYWMQTTETTQAQWEAVIGLNPSDFLGADLPVEGVAWDECREFMRRLNEIAKDQLRGMTVGMPTEAQWEIACRAGSTEGWCFGDDERKLGEYAWCQTNSGQETHPVGQKKPNAWGLYDMHGNVWEWCEDWYEEKYASQAVTDPTGPARGEERCLRGGSFDFDTQSANRHSCPPENRFVHGGLRAALR